MNRPTPSAPALPVLDGVHGPADLRALGARELVRLAGEIRALLIGAVPRPDGHLGANLGVVELTIALHRVFDSPGDAIVFDGGHQTYAHKVLTGRWADFALLRRPGGLCAHPSRAESPHDLVENSHGASALSYADGLSRAAWLGSGAGRHVVAVVGDGALTGGQSWEALNNIATGGRPLVVVLNDNGRCHGPTAGAVGRHLAALRAESGRFRLPVFECLGLPCVGPVDGHDIAEVEQARRKARALGGPVVVHCVTTEGKGLPPGLDDQVAAPGAPTWTSVFADALVDLGGRRPDLVCLTAATPRPTGVGPFAAAFPDRAWEVGAAGAHAATCAAGLAMGGAHPVVALRSAHLARAADQVLMDVALHGLPVTFVLDHAGVTGEGPSDHGLWDLALLGPVPGLRVAVPRDGERLRALLAEAVAADAPTALRFPRGAAGPDLPALRAEGGVDVLYETGRRDVLLVAVGPMATTAIRAALRLGRQGLGVTVCDPRWVAPVDRALVELARSHRLVVCVEDGARVGGAGALLAQAAADAGVRAPVRALGLPAEFLPHGPRADILRRHRLDATGITRTVTALIGHLEHLGGEDSADHPTRDARDADHPAGPSAEVPSPRGRQRAGRR